MRRVGHERALCAEGALDPVGHLVEGPGHVAHLVGASELADPGRQVAPTEAACSCGEPGQGPRERAGEYESHEHADRQPGETEHHGADRRPSHRVGHALHIEGDPHRSDDDRSPPRVVHDGRRREQQIDVEFLARAHQGVGFAVGERGHHLRALRRGVVLAHGRARWLWERVRVGEHLPGLVHHQHPSVDLLGVAFGLTGESVARHGCQRRLVERGSDACAVTLACPSSSDSARSRWFTASGTVSATITVIST